jgi:hypothetical protein
MSDRLIAAASIAEAMGMQVKEFKMNLPHLLALGFPTPADDAWDFWNIGELLSWVARQQETNICLLKSLLAES